MVLRTGASYHPWFGAFGRDPATGGMTATVEVRGVHTPAKTQAWNPLNGGALAPVPATQLTLLYRGPGRVIMNQDWRARKNEWNGQTVVEHAVSVMVNLTENSAPDYLHVMPTVPIGAEVTVVDVPNMGAMDSDKSIMDYIYTVRIAAGSTSSWMRDLLCDIIPDNNIRA
jgi:hypothetical protein